jgi:hypothetical protein
MHDDELPLQHLQKILIAGWPKKANAIDASNIHYLTGTPLLFVEETKTAFVV